KTKLAFGTHAKVRFFDAETGTYEPSIYLGKANGAALTSLSVVTYLAGLRLQDRAKLIVGYRMPGTTETLGLLDIESRRFDHSLEIVSAQNAAAITSSDSDDSQRMSQSGSQSGFGLSRSVS